MARDPRDFDMPELAGLPLPGGISTRSRRGPNLLEIAERAALLLSGRRRETRTFRLGRTPISSMASRTFITQMFADLGLSYTSGPFRNTFLDPYSATGASLSLPSTLEELVEYYLNVESQHVADQVAYEEDDAPSDEEEEDDDDLDDGGEGGIISDDEDEEGTANVPLCNEWRYPTFSSNGRVTACVWIRYVMRGEGGPHHHYDSQYGPIRMTMEQYNVLKTTDVGGREARVQIAEELIEFDGPAGSRGHYNYDAGIVNPLYHTTTPYHNTGEPVYPAADMIEGAGASAYDGAGTVPATQRLSYAETIMVDHPFLSYSRMDLLQDDEGDVSGLALEEHRIRDPYLRQHFVQNCCWMSHIIELVNTNTKRLQLTYESLWSIMKRPGRFDPIEARTGLNVEDMVPVFDHFDREVYVYDMDRELVYQRNRPPRGMGAKYVDVHPYTWRFMVTENHVYVLPGQNNVNMQSVFGWKKNYFAFGDAYDVMYGSDQVTHPYCRLSPLLGKRDFQKPMDMEEETVVVRLFLQHTDTGEPVEGSGDDDDSALLTDILFHERYSKENSPKVVVLVSGCLIQNVILPLIRDYHYKPRVCFINTKVRRVSICSMLDRGYIVFKSLSPDLEKEPVSTWVPYVTKQYEFYKQLMDYASTFDTDTMHVLRNHVRGGLFSWTAPRFQQRFARNIQYDRTEFSSIDVNRLYPSCLKEEEYLPVVTCFDTFKPVESLDEYTESGSRKHDLWLVAFYGTSTIYSDRSLSLCFRKNLDLFLQREGVQLVSREDVDSIPCSIYSDGQVFVVPIAVLKTNSMPNTLRDSMQTIWNDETLPRNLRKLVLNTNIGKLGVALNEKLPETHCFTTRIEADAYKHKHGSECTVYPVAEDLYICQRSTESVVRLQGGYLLHLWVLDQARWRMQTAYDELMDRKVDVMYCCCDELFFPSNQEDLVQPLIPEQEDKESFEAFGHFKRGYDHSPLCDLHTRQNIVGQGAPFMYPVDTACMWNDLRVRHEQASKLVEVTPTPTEYNIQNLADSKRLLIKASVPGAGKSHAVLSRFGSNAVVVCPTNALCIEFERKYEGVVAMTLHRFLRISSGADCKQTFQFLSKRGRGAENDTFEQLVSETSTMYDTRPALDALDSVFNSNRNNPEEGKVLVLDEIYMYSLDLLIRLHFRLITSTATSVYATGDINQLPPIDEPFPWMRLKRIKAIDQLFPTQMTLQKCKRMSNDEDNRTMESICSSFLNAPSLRDVKLLVRMYFRDMSRVEAIKRLAEPEFLAVCYYNNTCNQLATSVISNKATVGVRLVNRKRVTVGRGRVLQVNYEYEVVEVTSTHVKLKSLFDEQSNTRLESVSIKHVREHMHWTKTRTCHSLQGSSVSGKLLLFDISSAHVTREFLYVALTRARNLSEVYIVPDRR